jgi:hypothetical protein
MCEKDGPIDRSSSSDVTMEEGRSFSMSPWSFERPFNCLEGSVTEKVLEIDSIHTIRLQGAMYSPALDEVPGCRVRETSARVFVTLRTVRRN